MDGVDGRPGVRGPESFELAAVAYRNGRPESWHFAAAAVATPGGRLVAGLGDVSLPVYLRSGAKPFQAVPLVAAGGADRYRLDAADLALICASHSGTAEHVRRAETLLERGGFGVEDLLCGSHLPFDEAAARELTCAGREATPLHNNCSGKHAGMLLACRMLELPTDRYTAPEHPLQRRILAELSRFGGLAEGRVGLGVDGCGAPAFRLRLASAARSYAALAEPAAAGIDGERRQAAERIAAAMTAAPEMVAGPGRFTTRLMEVTGGRILAKEGADGFYAAAVRGPVGLGVALKIADGSEACRDGVVVELLRQLGVLSGREAARLASFHRRPIRNRRGDEVGELRPELELREIPPARASNAG